MIYGESSIFSSAHFVNALNLTLSLDLKLNLNLSLNLSLSLYPFYV